jgi:hypothetical protein
VANLATVVARLRRPAAAAATTTLRAVALHVADLAADVASLGVQRRNAAANLVPGRDAAANLVREERHDADEPTLFSTCPLMNASLPLISLIRKRLLHTGSSVT